MKKLLCNTVFTVISLFYLANITTADELDDLKKEMQKIQGQNAKLQEHLDRQNGMLELLLKKIDMLEDKDRVVSQDIEELRTKEITDTQPVKSEIIRHIEQKFLPNLDIRGFADITFKKKENALHDDENSSTAALGQLDLFFSSELSDKISYLGETVFEHDDDNDLHIEVERLQLKYSLSDFLNITIGRMHTALGFWNTEYHHSTWLHTTADRPIIYEWEDEGGIIPNHFVGLYVSGKKEFEKFEFEYDLGVANGRGKSRTEIQSKLDRNDFKAFNARLQITPYFLPDLTMGVSTYIDKIPADSSTVERNGEIDELILGGHIIYIRDDFELLAEILNISHDDDVTDKDYDTLGFYLQGAYQFEKWKPYYRLDFVDFSNGDPYYADNDLDVIRHTVGVRWDPITWNSIKLEYNYNERNSANDTHEFTIQSAFTF